MNLFDSIFNLIGPYGIVFIIVIIRLIIVSSRGNSGQSKRDFERKQKEQIKIKQNSYTVETTSYGHVVRTGTMVEVQSGKDVINDEYDQYQYGRMAEKEITPVLDPKKVHPQTGICTDKPSQKVQGVVWNNQTYNTPQEINLAQKLAREKAAKNAAQEVTDKKLSDFFKKDE